MYQEIIKIVNEYSSFAQWEYKIAYLGGNSIPLGIAQATGIWPCKPIMYV